MNAKEKQREFIKAYLKPTLSDHGYRTSGQTWWKDRGDFFNLINLQNYSWNSKDSVDFRFNIGIALKAILKDIQKGKPTYYDLVTHFSECTFIPDCKNRKFGNNQGYSILSDTDLQEFISALKIDFEFHLLPALDKLASLSDCLKFHPDSFWGAHLRKVIEINQIEIK